MASKKDGNVQQVSSEERAELEAFVKAYEAKREKQRQYHAEYRNRPGVREKQRAYHKAYNAKKRERDNALRARAAELGMLS